MAANNRLQQIKTSLSLVRDVVNEEEFHISGTRLDNIFPDENRHIRGLNQWRTWTFLVRNTNPSNLILHPLTQSLVYRLWHAKDQYTDARDAAEKDEQNEEFFRWLGALAASVVTYDMKEEDKEAYNDLPGTVDTMLSSVFGEWIEVVES